MLEVLIKSLAIFLMLALSPFALGIAKAEGSSLTRNISEFYSDIDMQMSLVAQPNAGDCIDDECLERMEFDDRVQWLGNKLAHAAYAVYPELKKRTPSFQFEVVNKLSVATASTTNGRIVVFRGLQQLALGDEALSYVLAREMGHVIGQHHTQNIATKLMITAVASILFPALAIVSASSTAAQASTATSLVTSAASSVTSLVGAEVAMKKAKPDQMAMADNVALNLMLYQAYDMQTVVDTMPAPDAEDSAWMQDLHVSANKLEESINDSTIDLAQAPI